MPTGYTYKIKDGQSFKDFVMGCARAFGACVTMRDEGGDAEIPEEFKVDTYHNEELIKAQAELEEFKKMTPEDYEKEAQKEFKKVLEDYERRLSEHNDLKKKYTEMLQQVRNWVIPSHDHLNFKKFMIEQINISIDGDCYTLEKPKILSGADWASKRLKHILWEIEYHQKEQLEEAQRVAGRNEWLRKLRGSLK
jgi:hypothetical protein